MLVGEGLWDSKKNQIYFVACRFLNMAKNSYANAHVGLFNESKLEIPISLDNWKQYNHCGKDLEQQSCGRVGLL